MVRAELLLRPLSAAFETRPFDKLRSAPQAEEIFFVPSKAYYGGTAFHRTC